MARSINYVNLIIIPGAVGGGGLDGDALLALEVHGVHLGPDAVAAADLVDLVDAAGVEEDPLGEGGLAGVDVGGDPDVADVGQQLLPLDLVDLGPGGGGEAAAGSEEGGGGGGGGAEVGEEAGGGGSHHRRRRRRRRGRTLGFGGKTLGLVRGSGR